MSSSLFEKIFKFFKAILMALNSILSEKEKEDFSEEENIIFENDENNKEEEKEQEEVIFNTNTGGTGGNGLDLDIKIVSSSYPRYSNLLEIESKHYTQDELDIYSDSSTGIVVANGTLRGGRVFELTGNNDSSYYSLEEGDYYLAGGQYSYSDPAQGGIGYEYFLELTIAEYTGGMWLIERTIRDTGNGVQFHVDPWVSETKRNKVGLRIFIGAGQTVHNLCFTPFVGKEPRAKINDIIIYQDPISQTPVVGTEIPNIEIASELNTSTKGHALAEFELENNTCLIQNGRTSGEVGVANYYPTLKIGNNIIDCYPLGVYLYDVNANVYDKYEAYIFTGAKWIQISSDPAE